MSVEVKKTIQTGYAPRPLQKILHRKLKRFNVIVCHRRFGKTVFAVNEMIDQALRNKLTNPQYAYLAPFRDQAKRVAWDYLKRYTSNIPGVEVNEAELRIDIPRPNKLEPEKSDRIRLMILGADNPAALKGIYLDGAILDEYAEMHPSVWREAIRPTLSDRMGWAIFIGTPKGQNAFYDLYDQAMFGFKSEDGVRTVDETWFCALYKASETGIIQKSELEALKREMSEEEYDQEFECSFVAALVGAYYGKLMAAADREKRITAVHYEENAVVDTFWDLGIGDTTAIWFVQQIVNEIHIIDYEEHSGVGIAFYAKVLKDKGYVYGRHYLPHDGAARELGTGKSRQETLRDLGIRTEILPKLGVDDGIQAARVLLPRCYFDRIKCDRGIKALQNYRRAWDEKNNIFKSAPLHNWASNGSDAFRTMAIGLRREIRHDPRGRHRDAETEHDIFA